MSLRRPIVIALVSSVALAGLVTVTATGASGAAPAAKLQPRAVSNTTTWAAVKTVSLPGTASNFPAVGIAVNSADDTVYVVNSDTDRLAVINGKTGTLDDSFTVTNVRAVAVDQNDDTIYTVTVPPTGTLNKVQSRSASSPGVAVTDDTVDSAVVLAVDSLDDTVYVARVGTPGYITYFSGRTPLNDDTQNVGGRGVYGLAVDQLDDSVWMAYAVDDSTRAWNGRTLALGGFIGTGDQPVAIALDDNDDSVYVASDTSQAIAVVNGQTNSLVRTLGGPFQVRNENGLAVDDSNGLLFTASWTSSAFGVIKQATLDDSVYLTPTFESGNPLNPRPSVTYKGVAVDDSGPNHGLVWAYSPSTGNVVQALTQVSTSLTGTTTGAAGARVFVTVTSPTVVAPFVMDTDTVLGVRFNSSSLVTSITREDDTTWSVALPSGLPAGNVPVEVQFNGLQYALAGTYTVQSSGPPPTYPPDPPTSVSAVAGDAQATVSWTAPSYAGSFPITDYMATSSPGGWLCIAKAPATSCTVSGLTNGVSYTFTAQALNGAGWSVASQPSSAVTPRAPNYPPGAPTGVSAVAGDASATVSWTAPSYVGSSAITDYEVVSSPGSQRCVVAAPATTCAVEGLTNGTSYTFTARAINGVGWGEASQPSNAVTPKAPEYPPGAPTSVSAVAGDAQATVSWMAPSYSGTSPITGYEVVSSPGSRTCEVAASARTCTVSGLTNGTSYTFTVRAENVVGWGEASQPSNAVTPQAPVVESISIVGSRDEDDPGRVRVSGLTVGLVGQQVTPYVRFPGQTAYTAGVGTRTVDSDGTFEWQRKTGKKIYVYFAHGNIRSTIAIIAAK